MPHQLMPRKSYGETTDSKPVLQGVRFPHGVPNKGILMFLSYDEIVDSVYYTIGAKLKLQLKSIKRPEYLIAYHHTLGRYIRNEYLLWDIDNPLTMKDYEPILKNGIDINPNHPDCVSNRIIFDVWTRIQNES